MSKLSLPSFHDKSIQEAGKKLLLDSVDVGRNFCNFMISTSVSSIPIYMAIIAYLHAGEKGYPKLVFHDKILILFPCALFVISMFIFILAYIPNTGNLNLDNLSLIEKTIADIVSKRRKKIIFGLIVFFAAMLNSLINFFFLINKNFML